MSATGTRSATPTDGRGDPNFRAYLVGVATWFVGLGLQFVLMPWLVALELRASPAELGIAQMSILLPMLLFVLPAGVLADRREPLDIILWTQAVAIVPPLLLAVVIFQGSLTFELLLAYGLTMGTLAALIAPAREGIVPRVAGGNLQRAVTAAAGVQFGVQVVAYLLVFAVADSVGAVPILVFQSALYFVGWLAYRRLRLPAIVRHAPREPPLKMIADGFRVVRDSRELTAVMLLNLAVGVFYMGSTLVCLPLLIRDIYAGTQSDLALTNTMSTLGTIVATVLLLRSGGVRRRGQLLLQSLLVTGVLLLSLSLALPFAAMLFVLLLSGCVGGAAMVMARTLAQEAAPDAYRSRVMSLYTLSVMGGAPLGSALAGVVTSRIGVLAGTAIIAATLLLTAAVVGFRTGIHRH